MKLSKDNPETWLATIEDALGEWEYEFGHTIKQERYDDVNTAIAWIREALADTPTLSTDMEVSLSLAPTKLEELKAAWDAANAAYDAAYYAAYDAEAAEATYDAAYAAYEAELKKQREEEQ